MSEDKKKKSTLEDRMTNYPMLPVPQPKEKPKKTETEKQDAKNDD